MSERQSSGFSFIEILISLMLLSLVFLGVDTVGYFSLHTEKNGWYLTVASNQVSSMGERLRALGDYEGLKNQIALWNQENQAVLPKGQGKVTGKFPDYTIVLHWDADGIADLTEDIHL